MNSNVSKRFTMGVVPVLLLSSLGAMTGYAQRPAPMTEWYYADGTIQPDGINPKEAREGVWSPAREWMVVFNLSQQEAVATARFYFEDIAPREYQQKLPARSPGRIVVHELPEIVPPKKLYAVRVRCETPVVVQPTRAEYEPWNPVSHAMASFVAYPGPLGKRETRWIYADGLTLSSGNPLEEWEWISILNPDEHREAKVKITFNFAGEQKVHDITVPAERVRSVDMYNLPIIPKNKISGPIIESDIPIVVEQVRRAYTKGIPVITALWATLAYPVGDTDIH